MVGFCDAATVTGVDALSIRAAPDRTAPALVEIANGKTVDVYCMDDVQADGNTWVCVHTGSGGPQSTAGWISTNYLTFKSDTESASEADQSESFPDGPVATVCDWATVVRVDSSTIRAEPTHDSTAEGIVPNGERVAVFCGGSVEVDGGEWVPVRAEQAGEFIVGWMRTTNLDFEFGGP
jgi:hypothetical protein